MKAYPCALRRDEPERDIRATLLFSEADVVREFLWESADIQRIQDDIDQRVCAALSGIVSGS
jgi:hypothetical protein